MHNNYVGISYVNTIHNDEGYKMSPLENYAYFDSDNKENGKDIFKLRIPKPCEPEIKRVKVEDLDNYPLDSIKVLAIDPCDNDTLDAKYTDSTGIAILLIPSEEKIDKISSEIAPGNTPGNSPGNTPGILQGILQKILHQLRITMISFHRIY